MKRDAGGELEQLDPKKVKMDGEPDDLLEVRVLIDNYEASVIIGKGGSNVKAIRTESGAFVSILRNDFNSKERVMTLKGKVEFIAKAAELICSLLLEDGNAKKEKEGQEPEETATLKFLHHKACAGAIIGKGGAIIREIQEQNGVRMSLSTEPLGASTEKTCQITGTPLQVQSAITRVLVQLNENPPRAGTHTVLYVPGGPPPGPPAGQGYPPHPYGMPAGYGAPPPSSGYGAPPSQGGYYGAPHPGHGASPYGAPAPSMQAGAGGPSKTEKIVIPTVCAGTVIGKGGSIIRDIKMQSQTIITIADPEPTAPGDRVVSITGTSGGIQLAISLIRHRVESYSPPNVQ